LNFLFAWRYFKSKKTTNAINIIAWISMVAITVVVASLIVVFSVFNGFEGLVKSLYKDFYADISIKPSKGKVITLLPNQRQLLLQNKAIAALSFSVEEKAFLVNGHYTTIAYIKGVDSAYTQLNNIAQPIHTVEGKFAIGNAENPNLVIGYGIQNAVAVNTNGNTNITLYLPNKNSNAPITGIEGMNSYNALVAGVFAVQQEFDNKYAFTNIGFMQYMLNMQANQFTHIEAKLLNNQLAETTAKQLQQQLGSNFLVATRYQQNKSLYVAMQIEKWVIYGVTSLILLVAAFNIIGALTMLVLEKQKDIAVLKAMGATNQLIQKIFITEGLLLCGLGAIAGIVLATIICLVQIIFKVIPLQGGSFLIDYYPVQLQWLDYIVVVATVIIIALLAAYLPAKKAANLPLQLKS
jgi:lipoprotein-releasing system permease protein